MPSVILTIIIHYYLPTIVPLSVIHSPPFIDVFSVKTYISFGDFIATFRTYNDAGSQDKTTEALKKWQATSPDRMLVKKHV